MFLGSFTTFLGQGVVVALTWLFQKLILQTAGLISVVVEAGLHALPYVSALLLI